MTTHIGAWRWGAKYGQEYVDRLRAGVARHLKQPHVFRVWSPSPEDDHLEAGCLCRLRMFSPDWQKMQGIKPGDRIVCLDLDMVVTGDLDALFDRPEPFCILQGVNASNPCKFNGSAFMLRAGFRPDVWDDFSPAAAEAVRTYTIADDQRWMEYKLAPQPAWGPADGVYGFQKPGHKGEGLPANARLMAFFGARDPAQFTRLPWVQQNWIGNG